MKINETEVEFTIEERHLIKNFFDDNSEYINKTDLYNYNNLKKIWKYVSKIFRRK